MLPLMRHPTQLHSGGIDWPRIRILVFSQDDAFRFLTRQTFRKLNVREVLSTSVPADATPMMGQGPDIALVDVDGDVQAALAFLQRVRAADAAMPVLMVAKADDRALIAGALPLGIEGFVPKPVSGHELSHRVGDSLAQPRRIAAPKPVAKPAAPAAASPAPAPVPASAAMADGGALRAELAELTARLGNSIDGHGKDGHGGHGPLRRSPGGGTYGSAADGTAVAPAADAGAWLGDDDLVPAKPRTGGGTLDAADAAPAAPAATGKLEALMAALPDKLKPRRKRKDSAEQAEEEAERARWQAELAEAGHRQRQGEDVAGLDVDAIVAGHLAWLTTQGAEGKRAEFRKMDLAGADLAGTVLANAGFRDADLSDARLAEARLDGADFRHACLGAADLGGANLGVAQLRHCDLRLANLQGASLRGADLSGARLGGAKMAGADLKGATLVGSDLAGADLSRVDGLTQGQVDKAVCNPKTKLPPGVFRPRKQE
ncbi:MAG: pentapeptide repeat-containing protein [Magnetospirillum sp.]|nr:pentapeptide repeat-containing protein [Magnetospirillum sp.]